MNIFMVYFFGALVSFLCTVIWAIWMFDENVKVRYGAPDPWETLLERVGLGFMGSVVWPISLLFVAVRATKKFVMRKNNG